LKDELTLKWCKGCKRYVLQQLIARGCWTHDSERQIKEIWGI